MYTVMYAHTSYVDVYTHKICIQGGPAPEYHTGIERTGGECWMASNTTINIHTPRDEAAHIRWHWATRWHWARVCDHVLLQCDIMCTTQWNTDNMYGTLMCTTQWNTDIMCTTQWNTDNCTSSLLNGGTHVNS